jgi:drug/metabolite transporter (DMT)-like permease
VSFASLILPLGAGLGYACAAVAIKRALGAGTSSAWVNFLCNSAMALLFQSLWIFPGHLISAEMLLLPALCGFLFFLGQIFTFKAIETGDVSVATPLLGTKVILVALFSWFLTGKSLPHAIWGASVMASFGIALISYAPGSAHSKLFVAVIWSLGAAAVFALTDVFVQRWVPMVGYSRFAPVMFGVLGLFSLFYVPSLIKKKPLNPSVGYNFIGGILNSASPWLLVGALLLSLQALAMYSAIGLFGSATMTNIIYGSRCMWSVLLVWILGPMAGDIYAGQSRLWLMASRLLGALLLFGAMALVLS